MSGKSKGPRAPKKRANLPSREDLLAFLTQNPGAAKRDLARHYNVKGNDKIELKRMLRDLQDEGALKRGKGKTYTPRGLLPEVTVVEVIDRDPDGELLCKPSHWESETKPPQIMLAPGSEGQGSQRALGIGERFLARLSPEGDGYVARVIKRLGASAHKALGVFRKQGRQGRIEPVDRKARHDFTVSEGDTNGALDGELVVAEPIAGRFGEHHARVRERLGKFGEPRSISLIAIHAHGIPDAFPAATISEAEAAQPATLSHRTDLRAVPLVTIDPPDARDHDDAVWAETDDDPANKGGFRAIVAIADVAHYVTPGSALDREASKRGNSCYFPDRVVPMLPEALSADLCSLKEGVDRAVLVAHMTFGADGRLKKHRVERALMRSAAKLSYGEVQDALDGRPNDKTGPLLEPVLKPLHACYRAMAKARDQRGPLDLDLPEHKIQLSPEGKVASIGLRERLETHRLIEEFMIQANVVAAEVLEARKTPLVYRIHAPPSAEKLNALSDFLATLNISLPKGQTVRPSLLNRILDQARNTPHTNMINEIMLRSQSQAEYNPNNIGHFGLALRRYAHFTSPIRRYADLIVHRALIRALQLGPGGLTDGEIEQLEKTAQEISNYERRAMAAERDSTDRYIAAYMADRVGAQFTGRISGVTRFGLFVRLSETGADGLIPVRNLGREFFHHDERAHALIGERSGLTYRLGTKIVVKLAEAVPLTGGLRFDIVEGGEEGAPSRGGGRGGRPAGRDRKANRRGPPRRR